ncbi:5-carboxymethyl-2-hydroxymuconate Delta-isomerase [Kitasatospora acidiphila]|uniref:5-carboxymethyl-2-hydroxymuconate Delta-isomerase n=1 Tax=Kitasatospora acidiphila TaxID=2567942 RepID=A0A540W0R0_9ACTN|nr:5-carboxymethyl-2-hydroxymuconate Delta-isomerase [Kitasatospora acidiphila]TQF02605.1 5-carboxymethyl-2-hydroxymuconate Delta-isomerase [Kitasatospora acidiphila]
MPHLVLEYSGNIREAIDPADVLGKLHAALTDAGGFRHQDFKSRAVRMDRYFIGDGSYEQSFVNLDIRTFAGKSAEVRAAVSEAALAVLIEAFATTLRETACDISVQITDLDRTSYARSRSADHQIPRAA